MLPAPVIAALAVIGTFGASIAVKNEAAPSSPAGRFFTNLAAVPAEYLESLVQAATGGLSNRFNPSGPVSFISDALKQLRINTSQLLLIPGAAQEGTQTDFALFSGNNESMKPVLETLRHTMDAFGLCVSVPAKIMKDACKKNSAQFEKNSAQFEKNSAQFDKTTHEAMRAIEDFATTFRKFFAPRMVDALQPA
jgi:hypothetical protein